ncbi:MAG TPA: hypothetical protein VGI88_16445 [Verrucomicrobiae bacterium]|jgi:hypothetical protein
MHPILADSIGPGLFWILILLAGIGCTVIAFAAIFPAALGHVRPAILMALPAFIFSILATTILVYFWHLAPDTPHPNTPLDAAEDAKSFRQTWIFFSGIPLALSLFVMLMAAICGAIRKRLAK